MLEINKKQKDLKYFQHKLKLLNQDNQNIIKKKNFNHLHNQLDQLENLQDHNQQIFFNQMIEEV